MKITSLPLFDPFRTLWKTLQIWWESWLNLWLFGLVLVLCWGTILLGPPATFGFFYAVRALFNEEEQEMHWRDYFETAKRHFLDSWRWFLANLFVLFLVYSNLVFYSTMGGNLSGLFQILGVGAGLLWFSVQGYALPYFVLMDRKSLLNAWKNGLFTILAAPLYSAVVFLVLGIIIVLHIFIMPVFLAGPGLIILLASAAVEDRIQKFAIRDRNPGDPSSP